MPTGCNNNLDQTNIGHANDLVDKVKIGTEERRCEKKDRILGQGSAAANGS